MHVDVIAGSIDQAAVPACSISGLAISISYRLHGPFQRGCPPHAADPSSVMLALAGFDLASSFYSRVGSMDLPASAGHNQLACHLRMNQLVVARVASNNVLPRSKSRYTLRLNDYEPVRLIGSRLVST